MSWTKINKPGAQAYSNLNPTGKEQYDQATLSYDDTSAFYDGVNPSQWTGILKPTTLAWTAVAKPT